MDTYSSVCDVNARKLASVEVLTCAIGSKITVFAIANINKTQQNKVRILCIIAL